MKKAWFLVAILGLMSVYADTASYSGMSDEVVMPVVSTNTFPMTIAYSPMGSESVVVTLNGEEIVSSDVRGECLLQLPKTGINVLRHIAGTNVYELTIEKCIRNVSAMQLRPHNKLSVCYELSDDICEAVSQEHEFSLAVTCESSGVSVAAATIIGDTSCTPGEHRIVWDMEADGVRIVNESIYVTIEYAPPNRAESHDTDQSVRCISGGCGPLSVDSFCYGYVGKGLIGCWDGIENVGNGAHSDSTSTWVDLTGNGWDAVKKGSYGKWTINSFCFTRSGTGYFELPTGCQSKLGKNWTIEVCVRPTTVARLNYAGICGGHTSSGSVGASFQSWDNRLVAFVQQNGSVWQGSGLEAIQSSEEWPSGKRTHLAYGVNDEFGVEMVWRDGAVVSEREFTPLTAPALNCQYFWIGRAFDSNDRQFDGDVYAVRVYDRSLTESEILRNKDVDATRFGGQLHPLDVVCVDQEMELVYSPIDSNGVSLEINGETVVSSVSSGVYVWRPERPGTYVLTHRTGDTVFFRRVVYLGSDDAKELEIGWLDGPVSQLFPEVYASVTNITIAKTVNHLPAHAFDGCGGLGSGVVVRDGCVLCVNGVCPENVVLPEGTRLITPGVFQNSSTLTSITIPEGILSIDAAMFANCTALESIVIPEGVEWIGDGAFRNCTWMQQVEFPSSLTNIGKLAFANCTMLEGIECQYGLETVGEGAFSNCWRMLSVALPASVDEIGIRAFYNCKSITGVTVPAHVDTIANLFPDVYQKIEAVAIAEGETELTAGVFRGCKLLEEVELSDLIEEIPDSTFEGCSELRRIRFPENLVRIGNRAFYGCGQVWQLEFPEGLEEIGDDAFNGLQQVRDLVCPASVKRIGARAFRGVWNDEEVKLPEGLESLGGDAFANCAAIRKISLPAVTTPIKSAFPNAYSQINSVKILGTPGVIPAGFCQDVVQLSGIKIPTSVTNIGNYAFSGLSNLAAIELPPNLVAIGEYGFNSDGRLTTVALPQSVKSVGYRAFYGCGNLRVVSCSGELGTMSYLFPSAYGEITTVSVNAGTTRLLDDLFSGCAKLSDIDLPGGITNIGARAFQNCSALASFGVPQGVVAIGNDVFSGCTGLTSLSLPEGLVAIPSGAFRNCRAISELVIPSSVTYLGSDAFNGCSALKLISYLGSAPGYDSGCYNGTPSDLVTHVIKGSRGWDGIATSKTLPEYWPTSNQRSIDYWTPNTFVATFDGNGGTPAVTSVVQTTGMTYILPEEDPEMSGARFNGWWTERVNGGRIKSITKVEVTRAQTFYAHWKYNVYSVRFDANGGLGELEDQAMTVNTPAELPAAGFIRKGHRFAGWALAPDGEVQFADGGEVQNLSLEQDAVVTLYAVWEESAWDAADYLNVPGMAFSFEGDADWVADDEVSHDGIGSMRSGAIGAAEQGQRTLSAMQTVISGAGSGSFWWKVDCEPNDGGDYYDYCAFYIDDVEVAKIAGTCDWTNVSFMVTGGGEHALRWEFTRDDYDENELLYENAAWVDELVWTPTPVTLSFDANGADGEVPASVTKYAGYKMALPGASALTKWGMLFVGWSDGENVLKPGEEYTFGAEDAVLVAVWEEKVWTLEEAANLTNGVLTTGGNANWVVDLMTNYDGVASIHSGAIGDSQESWVALSVAGPGTISFRTMVSGEFNRGKLCDYLRFEVDGETMFAEYDALWSNVVVNVSGTGSHTLKWTYLKNASKSAGCDCAWIDELAWVPSEEADPIPELVDPKPEEIKDVLEQAADEKLAAEITNATEYAEFREWADKVKDPQGDAAAGASGVMASEHAWMSYALGTEKLLEKAPTDADLKVEEFKPTAKDGKFDFTVSVKDVEVGSEASKENLKKVFGLEGSTGLSGFSADKVEIEFGTPDNGNVKFTAGPKDTDAKTFFMKVKIAQ